MIRLGGYQDQGQRKEQQDSFGFFESNDNEFLRHAGKLIIVADGMGGLAQGKDASQLAIKKFIESYKSKKSDESVSIALLKALHFCNDSVYEYSENQGKDGKIGTTLVAVVIRNNELFWISVGDSRIYLIQQDQLSLLTTDHSYETKLEELYARGKISKEDIDSHPQKASLTSYIGSEEIDYIARNTSPLKIFNQDKVLLCSDGLYSRLKDSEFLSLITNDPTQSCKNLVEKKLSLKIKSQDNLTAAIIQKTGEAISPNKNNNFLPFIGIAILAIVLFMFLNESSNDPDLNEILNNELMVGEEATKEELIFKDDESDPEENEDNQGLSTQNEESTISDEENPTNDKISSKESEMEVSKEAITEDTVSEIDLPNEDIATEKMINEINSISMDEPIEEMINEINLISDEMPTEKKENEEDKTINNAQEVDESNSNEIISEKKKLPADSVEIIEGDLVEDFKDLELECKIWTPECPSGPRI